MPKSDPGFAQIVGGHFYIDLVPHTDPNEVFPHFSGNMSQHFMAVRQRNTKHRAR